LLFFVWNTEGSDVSINVGANNANENDDDLPGLVNRVLNRYHQPVLEALVVSLPISQDPATDILKERHVLVQLLFLLLVFVGVINVIITHLRRGVTAHRLADVLYQVIDDQFLFGDGLLAIFIVEPIGNHTKHQMFLAWFVTLLFISITSNKKIDSILY
jgi:hypothetical protein